MVYASISMDYKELQNENKALKHELETLKLEVKRREDQELFTLFSIDFDEFTEIYITNSGWNGLVDPHQFKEWLEEEYYWNDVEQDIDDVIHQIIRIYYHSK